MPYGLATAGDVLTAANVNLLPRGRMGAAKITSNGAANAGTTTVSGLSVTFTALANRYYRITIGCKEVVTVGTGATEMQIWNGTSTQLAAVSLANGGASTYFGTELSYVDQPAAGSTTYNFRTFTSATSVSVSATATSPAYIYVEDIGGV